MWPFNSKKKKPALDTAYEVKYKEHEIEIISVLQGFILRRKSDGFYRVSWQPESYSPARIYLDGIQRYRWESTRKGSKCTENKHRMSYHPECWYPQQHKTLSEAIHTAIQLEKAADTIKDENLRAKNFVEQTVWRV